MKRTSSSGALLTSFVSLLLCCVMLLGTTFAWFTDTVTTTNNIIQSGALDVEFSYYDGDSYEPITGTTSIFNNANWEPGHTEVAYLEVSNVGDLALKYQLGMYIASETGSTNVEGNKFKLSDYIMYDVIPMTGANAFYADRDAAREAAKAGAAKLNVNYAEDFELKAGAANNYYAVVVYMPEEVGNEANYNKAKGFDKPTINLGLTVYATQLVAEDDSFGPDYDEDAEYPASTSVTIPAGKTEETVIEVKEVAVVLPENVPAGDYKVNVANKSVKENVNGETTVSFDIDLFKDGVKVENDGTEYTVNIEIDKNLNVTNVLHKGTAVDFFSYDPTTGIVTFKTTSFSPFAVIYTVADEDSVYVPSEPETAEKLEKEDVIAVDENGNEYKNFTAAVKSGAEKLYIKAGADLGNITHLDVANDLTIYGNGAAITGGEHDLAIDTYVKLEKDITVNVYNLHGIAAWGQRNTDKTVNINLYNCNDIARVYINGTAGVNNISLYNCTADKNSLVGDTAVYSNANGKLVIDGCEFTNIGCPINLNHKVAGEQTVIVTDTKFVDCSTEGTAAYYAPVRVYNSVEGANQTVTVSGNEFIYSEGKAPINDADVLLNAKHNGVDAAGTVEALVQLDAAVACGKNVDFAYAVSNASELAAVAENVTGFDGKTLKLTADIDLNNVNWSPIGNWDAPFAGTFDGDGYVIKNLYINDAAGEGIGLFGVTENATIKNVTVENVNVNGYSMVAGIVGAAYPANITNCHIKGNINIVADYAYTAGIAGYCYYGTQVDNCSAIAKEAGAITAKNRNAVGGITAWLLEGDHKVTNCTVKNMNLTGWTNVGGITGFVHYSNTIDGCTVENVTLTKTRDGGNPAIGLIAGGWSHNANKAITLKNNTVDGATLEGNYKSYSAYNELYGSEYGGATAANFILDNNNTSNITNNLVELVETIKVTTAEELKTAFANVTAPVVIDATGVTVDITNADFFEIPCGITLKGLTVNAKYRGGNYVVFKNGTAGPVVLEDCSFGNSDRSILLCADDDSVDSIIFNNCTFKGQVITNQVNNPDGVSEFNNCLFTKSASAPYNFTEGMGGTHVFNSCTFDYTGVTQSSMGVINNGCVNVYSEPDYSTAVILNSCTRTNCGTRKYGSNSTLTIK